MSDIAIIGISCKFPGAENVDEYWDLLINGRDAICKVPVERWQPGQAEFRETYGGFLKCAVDEFDAKFFGISGREAEFLDPQHRMLLEMTWTALEDAGINPLKLQGSETGVFLGLWRNDYEALHKSLAGIKNFRKYLSNSYAAASARISHFLGLTGISVSTDSACSSALMSIHFACQSLKLGESTLAITGGINLLTGPFNSTTLEHVLAPDGHCKSFDEKADGYGRAEGCGILILKKHSDAIRDGDRVLGLIRGTGVSQEGTSSSIGTPSKYCQVLSLQRALASSGMRSLDVDYIEAHGTGTPMGDLIEISAISEVYGKERVDPLIIGSVKANIGHTESASGVAGIIKVILAMNKGIIPPNINLKKLNPAIDLDSVPCVIPQSPMAWKNVNGKPRLAGVSSFGISGTNVHCLLQEASQMQAKKTISAFQRPMHILTLSAKSKTSLQQMVIKYSKFLSANPDLDLGDVCFSTNSGRAHLFHKFAVHDSSIEGIVSKLQRREYFQSNDVTEKMKVAFLFPGQGSQYGQMGKELYGTHPTFRNSLDYICGLFEKLIGKSLLPIIFAEPENPLLHESLCSQLSIFSIEYSLLQLWKSFGITPDLVIGHSLGEFAAAFAAGALSIEDVTKLLYVRTRLISKLPEGGMVAVKSTSDSFQIFLDEFLANPEKYWVDVACINAPDQIVISAKKETIAKLKMICGERGMKTVVLASHHAYHSREMDSILPEYEAVAKTLNYQPLKCQYISGVSGNLLGASEMNAQFWVDQCRKSVNFEKAIQTAINENCNIFIEIGSQPILLGLGMQCVSSDNILWLPSIKRNENNWTTILDSLSKFYIAGNDVDWKGFDSGYNRKKISLPTYPFQREKYWLESDSRSDTFISGGPLLHPLVGKHVQASISENIFQNIIGLKKFPYLADHQVANKPILPTSAMLEMMMVAGQETLNKISNTKDALTMLTIENVSINRAFEIEYDVDCISEIVVTPLSGKSADGFSIKLSKGVINENNVINWEECAVGKFIKPPINIQSQPSILDLNEIISSCMHRNSNEMYTSFWNVGLTFGNAFKSITNIWENKNQILAQIEIHETENGEGLSDYLGHPILIDGMIQLCVSGYDISKSLNLPVGVKRYTWMDRSLGKMAYAYAKYEEDGKISEISLYDEGGKPLALIEGISLIKSTINSFLKSLHSTGLQLPRLYEELWVNKPGHNSNRAILPQMLTVDLYRADMSKFLESIDKITDDNVPLEQSFSKLAYLYVLKTFVQLGWKPKVGEIVDHARIADTLKIKAAHKAFVFRLLEILAEEKFLRLKSAKNIKLSSKWQTLIPLPSISDINTNIQKEIRSLSQSDELSAASLQRFFICGEKLIFTLQGNEDPYLDLFLSPSETNTVVFEDPHTDIISKKANLVIVKYLEYFIRGFKNRCLTLKIPTLKILEIGAGTGSTTSSVLQFLQSASIKFRYMFTDTSSGVLISAQEKFKSFSENMQFKLLDIENDPLLQGFVPEQFDVVIASNVLHVTKDLKETILNCRRILTIGGSFVIFETLIPDRILDIMHGVLGRCYRFTDFNLRPFHAVIDGNSWCNLLEESGFESTSCFTCARGTGVITALSSGSIYSHLIENVSQNRRVWIIISDGNNLLNGLETYLKNLNRNTMSVKTTNLANDFVALTKDLINKQIVIEGVVLLRNECADKRQIIDEMDQVLKLTQFILTQSFSLTIKLLLITQGSVVVGDQTSVLPTDGLYLGYFKVLKNENPDMKVICIDLDANECNSNILAKQITLEAFGNDGMMETQIAIRGNERLVLRLKELHDTLPKLPLPKGPRFSICLPESKSYVDLKYVADEKNSLAANEVEVEIRASGLNFKDLMVILKPNGLFSDINKIGLEFSGIISNVGSQIDTFKIGDPVFGLANKAGCIASHIVVNEKSIIRKPEIITHSEAASIPLVFCTSIYCLENIAKLTRVDTVLIHAATGGVGLSAIQICKTIGARVVATAGSRRKIAYLRSLGIEHVFDSRSISYGEEIKEAVRGVDVVLNSLTGLNFKETTLSVCNQNARFIEIGAANIWRVEDILSRRPDVRYSVVDLTSISSEVVNYMLTSISDNLVKGTYSPLPLTQFDGRECRNAFEYFQTTQHIGKIVLSTPITFDRNKNLAHKSMLFSNNATYVITGGLGGIGLEVTKFMADYGARHIVLANRNPPNESAHKIILSLKEKSINVLTFKCDVSSFSDCQNLLETINSHLPPLKGIMHAATGYSEGIIPSQNIDMFKTIYDAKVNGAWNLHSLTRSYNLEHFVMFSSVTSMFSPMGLSAYSSANAYLDSLAQYRHSLGLPATSINWGPWSGVGLVADRAAINDGMFGVTPFSPAQGILTLKNVLRRNLLRVAVGDIDGESFLDLFPQRKLYIENLYDANDIDKCQSKTGSTRMHSETFYREIEALGSDQNKIYDFVKIQICNVVKGVLKLGSTEAIDENEKILDMGMDSFMSIEMKNKIKVILGQRISLATANADVFRTIKSITDTIVANILKDK